ncbi:outer membrane protein assembly factor BamA [Pelagerythrobacter rhizovicinus]|uniref:Outer membrane protein assembly factor BamA n=1 Tax=Pelagerythrobacter rhizovicinus TaxID=2268576 RepID=A0A4Q2KQL7_9SPHN|nr:outer membrane protein assembly factor BamA [Pelagerythrobacter rhizovicinus]
MIEREKAAGAFGKTGTGFALALLCGTMLAGVPAPLLAQEEETSAPAAAQTPQPATQQPAAQPAPAVAPQGQIIRSITVVGAQRLEPSTILSYIEMRAGDTYTQAVADQALKDLYATELFSEASVRNDNGNVVIEVTENPVINRIILEGNRRIKNDKILPEIRLAPRQIFTRSKVRADTARIIELYKRQGRFAASVEPQTVELSQNRVDVVFEISEGPKSKVRQINILGNEDFDDGELKGEMVTKEARFFRFFSSNTSYDPDRLAFDQQKLRQFYLTEGYADFRVVSAVAELTPDKEDFIITYVLEEGERYKFGDVSVDSQIRDFDSERMTQNLPMKSGDWYNAKLVEDTVEQLNELAGTFGYAFADTQPQFVRNQEDLTMDVTFVLREAPRVYVEQIDVNGNTLTQDKVVRREFRVAEGDAFNSLQVKRSSNRINSLGYFQENFEIEQKEGSAPDRIILEANVEEQPTGELQLSAGFSSIENFILAGSIRQRNFRGRGQTVGASVNWSRYSRSAALSFSEPYVFDRNISMGVDIYRKDYNSFNFLNNDRNRTFEQSTTGFEVRAGVPLTEYISAIGSYTLNYDNVSLDEFTYYSDIDGDGVTECDPVLAGRYLCEAVGKRTSSIVGLTIAYNSLDNNYRPTRGESLSLSTQYAGLGGSVKYLRLRAKGAKYWPVFGGFIFSLQGEGGVIKGLEDRGPGVDDVRLTDRFFLGEPQFRGFDIRGVGPRVLRQPIREDEDGNPVVITDRDQVGDDALGGNAYYLGRAELEIPLGSGAREMGLRPSIFLDVGALFNVTRPDLQSAPYPDGIRRQAFDSDGNPLYIDPTDPNETTTDPTDANGNPNDPFTYQVASPFQEVFLGDTASPRISVGIGVNWNSPFGPFRIDFAHVLKKEPGDDTKTFTFNVGTQF